MAGMKIPNVSKLITDCWLQAESALQEAIESKFPDRDEESITELFQGELRATLESASRKGGIADAFLRDLEQAFPSVTYSILSEASSGLIATVNFHAKAVEKKNWRRFRPCPHPPRFPRSRIHCIGVDYQPRLPERSALPSEGISTQRR